MAERARLFEGRKFLWDGEEHESEEKASVMAQEYRAKGFEVEVWPEEGTTLLYTRRDVTEAAVDEG
jgi:hypothetical protein